MKGTTLTCAAVDKEKALGVSGHNFKVNLLARIDVVIISHQLENIRARWTTLWHCRIIDRSFR